MTTLVAERQRLQQIAPVSEAVWQKLQAYVGHLEHWQKTLNLVAPSTLPALWERHILDSWQLLPLVSADAGREAKVGAKVNDAGSLVDLGSGAGLPGLVLAIAGVPDVHLIESNHRKAAFLRFVAEQTGLDCRVHAARAESVGRETTGPVAVMTARALTALPGLLGLCLPFCDADTQLLLPKGARWQEEVRAAEIRFSFALTVHESVTDQQAVILELRSLAER